MEPLIVVDQVTYRYPIPGSDSHPALHDLSLHVNEGEYVAILGANGSGKSTLARHLNALLLPDQGRVTVNGLDTQQERHRTEIRRNVGMVFQRPEDQIVSTIVSHDVAFGPENLGLPADEIRRRVEAALRAVDLWDERDRPPHMLSAGQMQRLALAGVLAMRPRCIIFDEVTAMLDPVGRRAARGLMAELHHEGVTVISITHLMEEAIDAGRVVVLHDGMVALDGTPEDVFSDVARLGPLGLGLPAVARLAHALRAHHPALPPGLLTLSDLAVALDALPDRAARKRWAPARSASAPDRGRSQMAFRLPARSSSAFVEATGLGHTYMLDTPFAQRALQDVHLSLFKGGAHGLIGATGSGKSTLLQHLNGLMRPQEGALRVGSYDLTDPRVDVAAVRRMVGLVFQMPEVQIFEQYVGDEIAYGPRLAGLQGEALRERVRWAMDLVGLDFDGFKDRFTFAISGGEKRKVALASTLALRPELLLLDEPTAGLDPVSRGEVLTRLKQLQDSGVTLLLSSHQMEDVAELSQRLTVMTEGTTVLTGDAAEVFSQGDRLDNWGLEQPVVTRLAGALNARGWDLPPLPSGIVGETQLIDILASYLEPTR